MGLLSLTITSNNQDFFIGRKVNTDGIKVVSFSTNGDQHLHFSFMNGHCIDCIDSNTNYPRILLPDIKVRGIAFGGDMVITNEHFEIPSRFNVKVYKSNGALQDGTVDIKIIFQISV